MCIRDRIIDYCHCPLEEPVHPNKDCSESQLRQRLQTVVELGGSEVWCAVAEEVIFYHLCRRHLKTEVVAENDEHLYSSTFVSSRLKLNKAKETKYLLCKSNL